MICHFIVLEGPDMLLFVVYTKAIFYFSNVVNTIQNKTKIIFNYNIMSDSSSSSKSSKLRRKSLSSPSPQRKSLKKETPRRKSSSPHKKQDPIPEINTEELNQCITEWYNKFFSPEDLKHDFQGCCNSIEKQTLIECYKIMHEAVHSNTHELNGIRNENIMPALIEYYYKTQVLEYYVMQFEDLKYQKIINHYDIEPRDLVKLTVYADNNSGILYRLHSPQEDKHNYYSLFEKKPNDIEAYVSNNIVSDPYVYTDKQLKRKRMYEERFQCFDKYHNSEIIKLVKLITNSNEDWATNVRKIIMNFNDEDFHGGGGGGGGGGGIKKRTTYNIRRTRKQKM